MSAVVCGKRSSSIFADELLPPSSPPSPHSHHHHQAKRFRRSPRRREALLHQLLSFFPDMDPQLLERALEASGDDLDSAIKSLKELQLGSAQSGNVLPTAVQPSVEVVTNGGVHTGTEHPTVADSNQASISGPEWVELFVREMTNASDMDDARARASRALEALKKSIEERAGAEAAQSLHQNSVLKRAVTIQHERQKEFEERSHEVQNLKQLVLQYQEQLRTLEINNYALTMHLKQAQQNNSMPGRYNPDVF